mgnify:CR=1 FL=1
MVFHYPPNPAVNYIKRVVGLPGDVVRVRDDQLIVNGQPVAVSDDGRYNDAFWCNPQYDALYDAVQNAKLFSSIHSPELPKGAPPAPYHDPLIPIDYDGEIQQDFRKMVLSWFNPGTAKALEPRVRAVCTELIDAFIDAPTFKTMYPKVREWLQIKQKYDPQGVFVRIPECELDWRPVNWIASGLDVRRLILRRGTLLRVPRLNPGDPNAPILPGFDIATWFRVGTVALMR